MNRSLAFVGACVFALVAAQPAVTLGAPPGGRAVIRPAAPAPHPVARGGFANQDNNVQVPFHINVQPLMAPQHLTTHPASFSPQAIVLPYRRYRWQSTPGYLWYPALYGPACSANNNLLNTSSEQLPADLTLGSLVDGKSSILSPESYNASYAAGNSTGVASSSPFALQVGFYPTACGAPGFTNL